jgi:hypothetical protein
MPHVTNAINKHSAALLPTAMPTMAPTDNESGGDCMIPSDEFEPNDDCDDESDDDDDDNDNGDDDSDDDEEDDGNDDGVDAVPFCVKVRPLSGVGEDDDLVDGADVDDCIRV